MILKHDNKIWYTLATTIVIPSFLLAIGKQHLPSVVPFSLSLSLSLFYLVGKAYVRIDANILEAPKNRVINNINIYPFLSIHFGS